MNDGIKAILRFIQFVSNANSVVDYKVIVFNMVPLDVKNPPVLSWKEKEYSNNCNSEFYAS